MAVLIASDLAKDMVGEPLLRGVSFKLERRDRLTIAGRNGAGKTTLMRMLSGETSIDGGELVLAKGTRVALHDQRPPRLGTLSLHDYVLSGRREPLELEQRLRALEQRMGGGDDVMDEYAEVTARYESIGGYTWRERATGVVHGVGFVDADLGRPLETFSGGQLTRASLARALAAEPDLLLLDEPTNHLDIESLEWLERTLLGLDAAIVLVAHDRWFLETVGTAVLELEAGRSRFFPGSWAAWRKEQAARELALGRAIERQQGEIARMERFIERFGAKATKARQAQSRAKALDKLRGDELKRDPVDRKSLGFEFKKPARSGRVIFELEDAMLQVGEDPPRVLLQKAELWLERGEHVTLVGANGTGKTTLIDALVGARRLDAGKLRTGHNVEVGYLSQHAQELDAGGARTVLEAAVKRTGLPPNQARALLGHFLFSGDEAEKPLDGLSGGERRRLSLAILVSSGANVLILDEPTNHLDLESREALEDALSNFPGSLLLVTHDRALLDAVGTRTVAIEDYTLRSYLGGWAEYSRVRSERASPGIGTAAAPPAPIAPAGHGAEAAAPAGKPKIPSKNALRKEAELERAVEEAEAALAVVEAELADPAAWATKYEAAKSQARHTAAKRAVAVAYAALEEHVALPT